MQAEIQSTNYIPGDPLNLQCFVQFTDNEGNTFTQSYIYPVNSDPLDQINADLTNYNLADEAASTSLTDIQTALQANPNEAISVTTPVITDPADPAKSSTQSES